MRKRNFSVSCPGETAGNLSNVTNQAGFTLVEAMVALVLIAIGAALTLPSFNTMAEKRQITNGAEQIMAFLNSAKTESIKQNRIATISYSTASTNWCIGVVLGATACDCAETVITEADYCAIDGAPWIINNTMVNNRELVTAMTGTSPYSFDPVRGIMVDLTDSLVIAMTSSSGNFLLDLNVNNTGQVSVCSKNAGHSVPGYKVCPP